MKKIFHFIIALSLTSVFTACYQDPRKVDPAAAPARSGTANFTKYIAVGNSLTAGFADGGLYNAGIANSYPNLLATQFRLAGGGAFVQPLFPTDNFDGFPYRKQVGLPSSRTCLKSIPTDLGTVDGINNTPQDFSPVNPAASCGKFAFSTTVTPLYAPPGANPVPILLPYIGAPLNNLGVPGIRVNHLDVPRFGSNRAFGASDIFFNPFYERMLNASNRNASYLEYVSAQAADATFFTCWLGNNDVLAYAMAGAPDAGTTALNFSNDMTDLGVFTTNLTAMVDKLTENNRRGVLVTIPYVDRAPFFTTIKLRLSVPSPTSSAPNAVRESGLLDMVNCGRATPINDLFIQAKSGVRAANSGDLFMLGSQGHYGLLGRPLEGGTGASTPFPYGLHPNNPLLDIHVLDVDEVADIKTRTDQFNGVMAALVAAKPTQLALVNINTAVVDALASPFGFSSFGITYRNTYLQGGAFSTDGIHLTPAGYAVVANEIIKATNARFGSAIPLINTAGFSTVKLYTSLCQAP